MKYTLPENAISSLSIAIENFKILYYFTDKYSQSRIDEATKICIVFLENSIELMLKTILACDDPLSIYEQPNSRTIRNALGKVDSTCKLEDILISEGAFRTITYTETVYKYNEKYHKSEKVKCILKTLGETRNAITHFGIDGTNKWCELIISILNTFDVIYNYLYPQLIELDDIGHYFTSDDIVVDTIHGRNTLIDDNDIYNNIIDFLDELMETSKEYVCALRASNPESKINEFTELMKVLLKDNKMEQMLTRHNAQFEWHTCNFQDNGFYFEIIKDSEVWDSIGSHYSPYFNITVFCGESGNIYFLIVHDKHEIYIYNQSHFVLWPQVDEPEIDNQWINDCKNGFCERFNLSKRNLLFAFQNMMMDTN